MEEVNLIFSDLVKSNRDSFLKEVKTVANRIGTSGNALMAVMWKESGLNPKAVNPKGGATGLIQFMPDTAKGLGTTTEKLYNMTNVEQLKYVEKYFNQFKGSKRTYTDLYLITFFPAALEHDDNWFFKDGKRSAELIGAKNPAINGGKPINKIAFRKYVMGRIPEEYKKLLN